MTKTKSKNSSKKQSKGSSKPLRTSQEAKSMEQLLAKTGYKLGGFTRGQIVSGKIIEIGRRSIIVDIGAKSEGIISERDFENSQDFLSTLTVGDIVEAQVLVPETPDGQVVLTLRSSAQIYSWTSILESFEKSVQVEALVKSASPSGLTVEVFGQTGFIPRSQLSKKKLDNPKELIDRKIKAKIVEVDRDKRKIVLSERAVSEEEQMEEIDKVLSNIKEGSVWEGVVESLAPFGAFVRVSFPKGKKKIDIEGLVHLSELSWDKTVKVEDLKVGEKVRVAVIGIERESIGKRSRLALSIKRAQEDPWDKFEQNFKKDSKFIGEITKVTEYGAFVQVEGGIEGLLHMSKVPPATVLHQGDKIECIIEEIDTKTRKVSLGLVLKTKPIGYK